MSESRATSARASSNSTSRTLFPPPGFDADKAAIAPSFATWRSFVITERSTPAASAAADTVVSPRINPRKISYFTDGAKNFFERPLRGAPDDDPAAPESLLVVIDKLSFE